MTDIPYAPDTMRNGRLAAAVAEVNGMRDEVERCHGEIAQLKADLHREEDRCSMLLDERNRLRKEVRIYHDAVIKLATAQANIGLLTTEAQTMLITITEQLDLVDGAAEPETPVDNKEKINAIVKDLNIEASHEASYDTAGQGLSDRSPPVGDDDSQHS